MLTNLDKKNAIWNSLSFIAVSLLGFVNFTLNYKTFSSNEFGFFILINALFGIGNTLDFGFGVSTVKYIAEARKKNDFLLVNKIFVSFFYSFLVLSSILVILYLVYFYYFFVRSEILSNYNKDLVNNIFLLLLLSFFFRYMNNFLSKLFEGFAEFILFAKLSLFIAFFNTFLMIIVFVLKLSIEYLAIVYLFTGVLSFVVFFIFSILKLEGLKFNIKYLSLHTIKEYAIYSINIQLSFFINSFIDPIVKYLLGKYFTLSVVTYYESAKRIIDLSNGLIFSAQKGLLNKLSENNALNNLNKYVNDNIHIYSKMSNYYSILIYGLLNSFLCFFIYYWFSSYDIMVMLLIFILPYSLINSAGCLYLVLMVEGKGFKLLLLQSINLIFVTLILFISLKLFNNYLGILGFYLATLITIALIFYFLQKYNEFNLKSYFSLVNYKELILLNLLVISEVLLLFFFNNLSHHILIFYLFIYNIIFYKYLIYFTKYFKDKLKSAKKLI